MKMTTCTVVVNWRYSCASPSSPCALRLAPDALRGSLAFREIQLPLCPMARPGLRLCSSSARLGPRVSLSCPGRRGTRGYLVESCRTRGSLGPPHDSTSPPAPRRRGGREARLSPVPVPSWVPVSTHRKAARSEPAERRPALLPGGQRSQAHSAEMETLNEAFEGQRRELPTLAAPFTLCSFHPPRAGASPASPLG